MSSPSKPSWPRVGAFQPRFLPPSFWRRPRSDREAQHLYNHYRTLVFWQDSCPLLLELPSLPSPLLPLLQDLLLLLTHLPLLASFVSLLVNIYLLVLPSTILFRCPIVVLVQMTANLWIDAVLWLVGVLGGASSGGRGRAFRVGFGLAAVGGLGDGLKRAGMRNLGLLENHLLSSPSQFTILLMPPTHLFLGLPPPPKANNWVLKALLVRMRDDSSDDPPPYSPSPTSSSFLPPSPSDRYPSDLSPGSPSRTKTGAAQWGWGGVGKAGEVDVHHRKVSGSLNSTTSSKPLGNVGVAGKKGNVKGGKTRRMRIWWKEGGEGIWG
ncbi:hypothetical protein BDY24DRAFT_389401 [Mrakia frigida]|uniref:uncharacterized protein n=1 Tax=Mrakia frigida TaxID=29902 RepID=UPI003FCC0825